MAKQTIPPLPLPKHWPRRVRSAAVHAIALARLVYWSNECLQPMRPLGGQ